MPMPVKNPPKIEPAVLDTLQLSKYIGVPVTTLQAWRNRPGAPAGFPRGFHLGRRVVYRKAAVDAWLEALEHGNTPAGDTDEPTDTAA